MTEEEFKRLMTYSETVAMAKGFEIKIPLENFGIPLQQLYQSRTSDHSIPLVVSEKIKELHSSFFSGYWTVETTVSLEKVSLPISPLFRIAERFHPIAEDFKGWVIVKFKDEKDQQSVIEQKKELIKLLCDRLKNFPPIKKRSQFLERKQLELDVEIAHYELDKETNPRYKYE